MYLVLSALETRVMDRAGGEDDATVDIGEGTKTST